MGRAFGVEVPQLMGNVQQVATETAQSISGSFGQSAEESKTVYETAFSFMEDRGKSAVESMAGTAEGVQDRIAESAAKAAGTVASTADIAVGKVGALEAALQRFSAKGFATDLDIDIPGFAGGTSFAPGGLALVGERGPEIVALPRGSEVIPNHRIPQQASADNIQLQSPTQTGGGPITIILRADGRDTLVGTINQAAKDEEITIPDTIVVRK